MTTHRTDTVIADRDIVTIRTIDAPRERVFAAWTDGQSLAQWWGPKGFTNTFHTYEPRPEGRWEFTMHGPDGKDYNNTSVYRVIEAPAFLAFDHLKPMHRFEVQVRFDDLGGRTRITWRMRFDSAEEKQRILPFVPAANEENMDRLEAFLQRTN